MVCIPCIVIPVLLYIWHRFFQPIVLKFWNPWKQVEDGKSPPNDSNTKKGSDEDSKPRPSALKTDAVAVGDCGLIKSATVNGDVKSSENIANCEVDTDHVKSE